jgi:hypothetical protein
MDLQIGVGMKPHSTELFVEKYPKYLELT